MRICTALFLCVLSLLSFPALAQNDPIKIGVSIPLTGGGSDYGADAKAGIDLAVIDINKNGGALGKNIEAVYEDDECDPKIGVVVANRLISQKMNAVVQICSMVCMATASIFAEENVPFLVMCNTDDVTSNGYKNIVRVYPKNSQEGVLLVDTLLKFYSKKKIGILYSEDAYDKNLSEFILSKLSDVGIKPSLVSAYTQKDTDYASTLAKLRDEKVDVVALALWPKAMGLVLRQAAELNYHPQFIGTESASYDDVAKIAGSAVEGLAFAMPKDPRYYSQVSPIIQSLIDHNLINRPFAVYSYLLMQVYAKALDSAKSLEPDALLKTLKSNTFDTLLGPVSFAENGDVKGLNFQMYQWKNQKYFPWSP